MENIRVVKNFVVFVGATILCAPFFVSAYEPNTTHKGLTRDIVRFFEYAYPDKQLTNEEQSWIEAGAVDEDANIRAVFHFYDPVHNRGLKGNLSSKEWAQSTKLQASQSTSYLASIGSMALPLFRSDTDFSWDRGVYEYVHGDKKRALESLGHALHLLEDATVPDHTRNDAHPPFFDSLFAQASPYEHWTSENFNAENISVADDLMKRKKSPVVLSSLSTYFDALASYSNRNFFSKSTIFDSEYESPIILSEYVEQYRGINYKFGIGALGQKLLQIEEKVDLQSRTRYREYIFDDENHLTLSDYWNLLSKQAVLHGAGVVKLFFDAVEEERRTHALLEKNKSTFARVFDNTKGAIFTFAKNLYGSSVTTSDLDGEMGTVTIVSISPVVTVPISSWRTRYIVSIYYATYFSKQS